jgi:hypothetical protein
VFRTAGKLTAVAMSLRSVELEYFPFIKTPCIHAAIHAAGAKCDAGPGCRSPVGPLSPCLRSLSPPSSLLPLFPLSAYQGYLGVLEQLFRRRRKLELHGRRVDDHTDGGRGELHHCHSAGARWGGGKGAHEREGGERVRGTDRGTGAGAAKKREREEFPSPRPAGAKVCCPSRRRPRRRRSDFIVRLEATGPMSLQCLILDFWTSREGSPL